MNMTPRLLLVLFSLVPALIAGQKYLRDGSMGSFYPNELIDDENGDRGGRFVRGYDGKNDDREDDDENTSNEGGSWRSQRFNRLNSELQILRNIERLENRLLAGIAMKRRTQDYRPKWETDEDEMDTVFRISPRAAKKHMRYWEKSCNCWKWVETHEMGRRGLSISAPMALVSHFFDHSKNQNEIEKNKAYLKGLGR